MQYYKNYKNKKTQINEFEKKYIVLTVEENPKLNGYHTSIFCNVTYCGNLKCYLMSKKEIEEFIKSKGSNCIKHISRNIKCDLDVIIDVKG